MGGTLVFGAGLLFIAWFVKHFGCRYPMLFPPTSIYLPP
jgi:hypothetical protein